MRKSQPKVFYVLQGRNFLKTHPNFPREGVAPLKDAKENGIPLDARWTNIKQELVNPEALEVGKERYEVIGTLSSKSCLEMRYSNTPTLRSEIFYAFANVFPFTNTNGLKQLLEKKIAKCAPSPPRKP